MRKGNDFLESLLLDSYVAWSWICFPCLTPPNPVVSRQLQIPILNCLRIGPFEHLTGTSHSAKFNIIPHPKQKQKSMFFPPRSCVFCRHPLSYWIKKSGNKSWLLPLCDCHDFLELSLPVCEWIYTHTSSKMWSYEISWITLLLSVIIPVQI